jgi:hypothetical protein
MLRFIAMFGYNKMQLFRNYGTLEARVHSILKIISEHLYINKSFWKP